MRIYILHIYIYIWHSQLISNNIAKGEEIINSAININGGAISSCKEGDLYVCQLKHRFNQRYLLQLLASLKLSL